MYDSQFGEIAYYLALPPILLVTNVSKNICSTVRTFQTTMAAIGIFSGLRILFVGGYGELTHKRSEHMQYLVERHGGRALTR